MRVILVSEFFPPEVKGGGEVSASLLAKGLSSIGVEVLVLTSGFPGVKKSESSGGFRIERRLATGRSPGSFISNLQRELLFRRSLARELPAACREFRPDIIHCMNITSTPAAFQKGMLGSKMIAHVNSPGLFCPKATLLYKDRELCTRDCTYPTFLGCFLQSGEIGKMHNSLYLRLNPLFIQMIRNRYNIYQRSVRLFDFWIATSSFMRDRLLKMGISGDKIRVVPNIIDVSSFSHGPQKKGKAPRILYLGAYLRSKGAHLLIDALKGIDMDFECDFYGEGLLEKQLKESASRMKKGVVRINRKVDSSRLPGIFQEHDIVVIPSIVGEGFNRVAVEAMASGKYIIASSTGGLSDILEESDAVRIVDVMDSGRFRDAIIAGMKGYAKARPDYRAELARYGEGMIARKTKEIYSGII